MSVMEDICITFVIHTTLDEIFVT